MQLRCMQSQSRADAEPMHCQCNADAKPMRSRCRADRRGADSEPMRRRCEIDAEPMLPEMLANLFTKPAHRTSSQRAFGHAFRHARQYAHRHAHWYAHRSTLRGARVHVHRSPQESRQQRYDSLVGRHPNIPAANRELLCIDGRVCCAESCRSSQKDY